MCQLLGMSFDQEVQPAVPFSVLVRNSVLHPDGWGIAYYIYGSKRATIFKEPIPAHESQLARFLTKYNGFSSRTFVAHIRKTTKGKVTLDNTHPFNRYYDGREYVFAHNGTLTKSKRLNHLYFKPIGTTDSERAFGYLLTLLRTYEKQRIRLVENEDYQDNDFVMIREILREINVKAVGSFCCIFSDGKYLFAYRDIQEARNLFSMKCPKFTSCKPTRKKQISKKSVQWPVTAPQGYIVATEPLIAGDWQPFTGGQLIVFKDGEIVANIQ